MQLPEKNPNFLALINITSVKIQIGSRSQSVKLEAIPFNLVR